MTDNLSKQIIAQAEKLGFDACGIAKADFLKEDSERMEQWLAEGCQGEMDYLNRNKEKRYDPSLLNEGTKTIVSVLYNYFPKQFLPTDDNFIIAKYAYGYDYHEVLKQKLKQLLEQIEALTGKMENTRIFVDSAPVMERAWAARCGLGFIGKNTCLIHPKKGSFLFIGQILLPIDIEPVGNIIPNHCGRCTRCIDACPTGALIAPFHLDARKCLSYLTIEYKGDLNHTAAKHCKEQIYGCDICQDVCPYNRFSLPNHEIAFQPSDELLSMHKSDWLQMDKVTFDKLFNKSAVKRAGFEGLKRNVENAITCSEP
ncbi:MAG: tRNA epoxyqueuosine(34) reductase QueG [Bacteroidales bacterium]|nr:tRNA epoxyqueuosine(34) reductase QueG [Bacteroidales bacterium]